MKHLQTLSVMAFFFAISLAGDTATADFGSNSLPDDSGTESEDTFIEQCFPHIGTSGSVPWEIGQMPVQIVPGSGTLGVAILVYVPNTDGSGGATEFFAYVDCTVDIFRAWAVRSHERTETCIEQHREDLEEMAICLQAAVEESTREFERLFSGDSSNFVDMEWEGPGS